MLELLFARERYFQKFSANKQQFLQHFCKTARKHFRQQIKEVILSNSFYKPEQKQTI